LSIVRGGFANVEDADAMVELFQHASAVVYTDGSCIGNGTAGARAGVGVFWGVSPHRYEVSRPGSITPATNNTAEFEAIEEALIGIQKHLAECTAEDAKRYSAVIATDANYVYRALTEWYDGWRRAGWKKADGALVANLDILRRVHGLMSELPVRLVHVYGHGTTAGNCAADELAARGREAAV
jgi:ribonuclease HI